MQRSQGFIVYLLLLYYAVGNLVASTLVSQPDKIVLNWNLSNSTNVEQYDVIYRSLSHSGNERTVSVTASSMSSSMSPTLTLTLMDLLHFTTYSVSVRAVCGGEMSLPTIKIVTTLASGESWQKWLLLLLLLLLRWFSCGSSFSKGGKRGNKYDRWTTLS